jgi:hypothetical protein
MQEEELYSSSSAEEVQSSSRHLDNERIQPRVDTTIRPVDVLCGRDKISFNHGTCSLLYERRYFN